MNLKREKDETMEFSATMAVNDVKCSRCSQLNEHMNLFF